MCGHNNVRVAISIEYVINIVFDVIIESLCDVTHIMNLTSYRADEISYIMRVM